MVRGVDFRPAPEPLGQALAPAGGFPTSLPPTEGLVSFYLVATFGSFAGAASVLRLSATATAKRLDTLERWYGGELIDRSRRPLQKTRTGEDVWPVARAAVAALVRLHAARSAPASCGLPHLPRALQAADQSRDCGPHISHVDQTSERRPIPGCHANLGDQ